MSVPKFGSKAHTDALKEMRRAQEQSHPEVTAENVTNEQIHELIDERDPTIARLTLREKAACIAALRVPNVFRRRISEDEIRRSRAICAAAINARKVSR